MVRAVLSFSFCLIGFLSFSQINVSKLVITTRQRYSIEGSDILVADTLVLSDSSTLVLNNRRKDNFIHAKVIIVGKGCFIRGEGKNSAGEKEAAQGLPYSGPCTDGGKGQNGPIGKNGTDGINLSLYTNNLKIEGSLTIVLTGGDGGNGGRGGRGGNGGAGTRVCGGGTGGNGGNGGKGGNGGNGGSLMIDCKQCSNLHLWEGERLIIRNFGGYSGLGGEGGFGGQAGLGPVKDGKNGSRGNSGQDGAKGNDGAVNFIRY